MPNGKENVVKKEKKLLPPWIYNEGMNEYKRSSIDLNWQYVSFHALSKREMRFWLFLFLLRCFSKLGLHK